MFKLEVDVHSLPADVVGEMCRALFWPPKKEFDFGCYSNFEYGEDVVAFPTVLESAETDLKDNEDFGSMHDIVWNRAKWKGLIECRWFWDGDGTLIFIFPDGSSLENSDCKKDYGWYFHHDEVVDLNQFKEV